MARTNLRVISVYFDDAGYNLVKRAATAENRSMSNFTQTVVIQAAEERLAGTSLADMAVVHERDVKTPAEKKASRK